MRSLVAFQVLLLLVALVCLGEATEESFAPRDQPTQQLKRFNNWFWAMSPENRKIAIRASQWGNGVFLRDSQVAPSEPRQKIIKIGDVAMEIPEQFTFCDASLKLRGQQKPRRGGAVVKPYGPLSVVLGH